MLSGEADDGVDIPLVDLDVDVEGGEERGLATTTIAVEGMTCGSCTAALEAGFKGVDGVESFTVSLMTERAVIVHDLSRLSAARVAEMYALPFSFFFLFCSCEAVGCGLRLLTWSHVGSRIVASVPKSYRPMYKRPTGVRTEGRRKPVSGARGWQQRPYR